jgi:hypothetical protein
MEIAENAAGDVPCMEKSGSLKRYEICIVLCVSIGFVFEFYDLSDRKGPECPVKRYLSRNVAYAWDVKKSQ